MDKEKFLKKYEALCKKYKIIITACGCCGSPFTYSENEMKFPPLKDNFEEQLIKNIEHLRNNNEKNK